MPKSSDVAGVSFTAFPAKDGEERAIVEAAIFESIDRCKNGFKLRVVEENGEFGGNL